MTAGERSSPNVAFYTCFVMLGLYISSYQNMADAIAAEYRMGLSLMGTIVAMHFVGSVIAPPAMGRLADARGARTAVLGSLGLIVVGLLAVVLLKSRVAAAGGILIVGCGFAAIEGLMTSALAALNPGQEERVINRSQMWFCVGAVIGPLLSEQGMKLGGWRLNELIMAAAFALIALFMLRVPMQGAAQSAGESGAGRGSLLRAPLLIALCAAIGLYVGVEQGLAFFMRSYYSAAGAAYLSEWALAAYWACMFLGRMISSLIHRHHREVTLVGLFGALLAMPCALMLGGAVASVVLFGLVGLLIASTWPLLTALAAQKYPERGATAMGYMMTAGALGGTLVPPALGVLGEQYGLAASLLLLPVLLAAVAALLAVAPKVKH